MAAGTGHAVGLNTVGMLLDRLSILAIKSWNLEQRAKSPQKARELRQTQVAELVEALADSRPGHSSINNKLTSHRTDVAAADFAQAVCNLVTTNLLLWEAQEILYNHDMSALPDDELRKYIQFFSRHNLKRNVSIEAQRPALLGPVCARARAEPMQTQAPKTAIVITTINAPTRAVIDFAEGAQPRGIDVVLVGDEKSPRDFTQDGARYFSIEAQRDSGFGYGRIAPTRHYARKNVGYLEAIRGGAEVIVDTDDDNIPLDSFWAARTPNLTARSVDGAGWINVYAYFTEARSGRAACRSTGSQQQPPVAAAAASVYCPIQQGLANENPDVDAIYRLVMPLPIYFRDEGPVALGPGTWCPFNSQNTTSFPDAFPLLYLPYYCSFRMTDIWRSFVAQRILHVNGWAVGFHKATVFQVRNEHNLMRDFEDEIPGYLHNEKIRAALDGLDLPAGAHEVPQAMRLCYAKLVDMGLVGEGELLLLDLFLADLDGLRTVKDFAAPRRASLPRRNIAR